MMRQAIHTLFAVLALAAIVVVPQVRADSHADPAITSVIQKQLDAFAAGDRGAAFAQASPSIRMRFGDSGNFMSMVRSGYSPLISPQAYDFVEAERLSETRVVQHMQLVDRNGESYLAHYAMELQPDGTWKIAGCRLEKLPGGSV